MKEQVTTSTRDGTHLIGPSFPVNLVDRQSMCPLPLGALEEAISSGSWPAQSTALIPQQVEAMRVYIATASCFNIGLYMHLDRLVGCMHALLCTWREDVRF